jgi:hypothetical protein
VRRGRRGLFSRFIERFDNPSFLDVFFSHPPLGALWDAVATILAGGAFLRRLLWTRLRLSMVFDETRRVRARRLRRVLPVESRLAW